MGVSFTVMGTIISFLQSQPPAPGSAPAFRRAGHRPRTPPIQRLAEFIQSRREIPGFRHDFHFLDAVIALHPLLKGEGISPRINPAGVRRFMADQMAYVHEPRNKAGRSAARLTSYFAIWR